MTTPTPLIYVSHLPSASSFYASLTQPLNLRYLSATNTFPATLHFGQITDVGKEILFSLTQSRIPNPAPTNIYLPAPSPKSIQDFFNKSRVLNPACRDTNIGDTEEGAGTRAITRDLDGNLVEAMYSSSRGGRRVQTLDTASTEGEAKRVLAWQRDVAKSVSATATEVINRSPARRAESYPQPMRLLRRDIITEHYSPHDNSLQSSQVIENAAGGGISGKAIIGTILGAAAGAAVAYAMVRSESPQRYPPTAGGAGTGSRPRRASIADGAPPYYAAALPPPVEVQPARSYVSARGEESPRYVQYTIAQPQPPAMHRAHTHDMSRMIDQRSHVSHRSGGSSKRSASEHRGSRFDRPLTIMAKRENSPETNVSRRSRRSGAEKSYHSSVSKSEKRAKAETLVSERKSHHSSSSSKGKKEKDRDGRSHVSRDGDTGSYASARSHRTESTIKPSSKSKSRASTATITVEREEDKERDRRSYVSAREVPLPRSTVSVARDVPLPRSTVSVARDVPLPLSVLSGRSERGGGYAASVAPSDSVSSVGLKRERERLRGRMERAW